MNRDEKPRQKILSESEFICVHPWLNPSSCNHPSSRFALRLKLIVNVRCSSWEPSGKGATNFTLSNARCTDLSSSELPERRSMYADTTLPLRAITIFTLAVESSSVSESLTSQASS